MASCGLPTDEERPVHVLLVSTNPRVTVQVKTALLGRDNLQVTEVRTPQRALQQLDDVGGFDVVVADADTAPTGGFYLAREMKAREEMGTEQPPLVLLIAREADRFLAKWSRADAFVIKPVDPFHMAAVLDALVAGDDVPTLPGVGSARGELPSDLQGIEGPQAAPPAAAGP
jgi:DNA-binding response OmpR family regulator